MVAIDSDHRLRGYSLSGGDPAASASLSYDDPSGFYAAGSAVAALNGEGPELLSIQANAGYAHRLSPELTIDAGILRSEYLENSIRPAAAHYTEIYAGLATRHFDSRIYFSPDYFEAGTETLYGELEAMTELGRNWRVKGHLGGLAYLGSAPGRPDTQVDWSVAASRSFGTAEVHAILSGRGPGHDYHYEYYYGRSRRTALVVGASYAF